MVDINELKPKIIEALKPLKPNKIILFGSYAYGTPTKDSDIDIFIIKDDLKESEVREYMLKSQISLWDLVKEKKIGFDVFVDSSSRIEERIKNVKDQFYETILKEGKVIYG